MLAGDCVTGRKGFEKRLFEGWCWQTSNFIAALLNDNDRVVRGYLADTNSKITDYFHGWIEIERFKDDYVFDSALVIFEKKKD